MIEVARYALAALVAQTHLWPQGADWMGQIAVFAFYTLSGYLMTRVLNTRYGFTWSGTGAFAINRILRLWPAYLVIMAIALVAAQYLPLQNFYPLIRTPSTAAEIITNAIVIGQVTFDFRQWLPLAKPLVTSWSLSVEICSYLLLAIFFARSPSRLWAFALLGVLAMAVSTGWCASSASPSAYGPYCFQNRYGVIQAGFVPFAFGGLYYFYEKALAKWINKRRSALALMVAGGAAAMFTGPWLSATAGPFLGVPLTYLLLSAAQNYRPTRIHDFFGRASYHLFIAHMPVGAVFATGLHIRTNSLFMYAAVLVAALGLSAGLVPLERWIDVARRRVASRVETSEQTTGIAVGPLAQAKAN